MHATSDPAGNLVVTSSESWLLVLAAALGAGAVAVWFGQQPAALTTAWSAGFSLGAVGCFAGWERSAFVFDRGTRELVWHRWTPFHGAQGRVPFGEITSVSVERSFDAHGQRSTAGRLVVHTKTGVVPITTSYEAGRARHARIGGQIVEVLHAGMPAAERIPFVV